MLFHFAHRTKNQKLLPAIHARTPHEHETPVTLSRSGDFIFLAALKYTLSLCHIFLLAFVRKIQKAQQCWAFQFRVLAHVRRLKLYEIFVSQNTQQHAKSSQSERTNCIEVYHHLDALSYRVYDDTMCPGSGHHL
jgi:hypothetical protein